MDQHTRTDLAQAILDHERGYLTTTGLVVYFFRIKLAEGKDRFSPKEIRQELGMGRSSFYKAIARLKADSEVNFEACGEISITNTNPNSQDKEV
jgi:hypothetical protein